MGFLDSIKNKMEEHLTKEVDVLIMENEQIELKYKAMEDTVVFTNKRLIIIDKKLSTGGACYVSIPYNKITTVFIQKPGVSLFKFREIGVTVDSFKYEFKATGEGLEIYHLLLQKTL